MFSNYVVYADESGDHGLANINPQCPVFVLTFCVFQKDEYVASAVPKLKRLKFEHWGHDDIVIHSRDIRKRTGDFSILYDDDTRDNFLNGVTACIRDTDFTIIAAVIDKQKLNKRYSMPRDPYKIALCFCLERLQMFLTSRNEQHGKTHILAEKRGHKEDGELNAEFSRIINGENNAGNMPNLQLLFVDKKCNSSGMQIADLVSYPIGQKILHPKRANMSYEVVEPKLRRGGKNDIVAGFGLKIFP